MRLMVVCFHPKNKKVEDFRGINEEKPALTGERR